MSRTLTYFESGFASATALAECGRYSEARRALRGLWASVDSEPLAARRLHATAAGWAMRAGRFPEARKHWKRALRLAPNDAAGHFALGLAHEADPFGCDRTAVRKYRKAIQLNANQPIYRATLGRALVRVDNVRAGGKDPVPRGRGGPERPRGSRDRFGGAPGSRATRSRFSGHEPREVFGAGRPSDQETLGSLAIQPHRRDATSPPRQWRIRRIPPGGSAGCAPVLASLGFGQSHPAGSRVGPHGADAAIADGVKTAVRKLTQSLPQAIWNRTPARRRRRVCNPNRRRRWRLS